MIELLPESSGNILAVKGIGTLTGKDYEQVFIPALNKLISEYQQIRVLFSFDDDFHGWELGAMWDDLKFGVAHRKDFTKIALVGSPKWVDWVTKLSMHLMDCQLETFTKDEMDKALKWLKS